MADGEAREDIVQLTVAAYDAAPDAALMRGLEAVVDGGGTLLDVAAALTAGERWDALYPSSQTPAEFADAWLGTLLPEADPALLAAGRDIVTAHFDAGGAPAALVLAAQDFLSGPAVPAEFAGFADAFLERGRAAMAELVAAETTEDIVQLAVAAYGAAPGAALMEALEAAVDGEGTLLDAAEALVADERWTALYPDSQTPAEFADAWLGTLLPGADPALLAAGRGIVTDHFDAGGGAAVLLLAAQDFLSDPNAPAEFAGLARAFLNRGEVAAEHSVARELDGTADELREVLVSVTDDAASVQAAIDALDDRMPGDQMPGDQMPGDQMPGDQMPGDQMPGGQTPGGGGQTPGGQTPGGGGGQTPGGQTPGGGGGQTPGGQTPGGGGGQTPGGQTPGGGGGQTPGGQTPGGGGQTPGGQTPGGGGQTPGGQTPGGGGSQTPVTPSGRDTTDDRNRVVLTEYDGNGDGTYDRAVAWEYGAGDLKIKTTWYDDWKVGEAPADQLIDRALTVADGDADGTGESRQHDAYAADGELILESLFDTDNAPDGSWERAEGYEYDASGRLVLLKTGVVDGVAPETAAAVWSKAEIYILNDKGGTAETLFFDAYDGSSDFAVLASGAVAESRLKTYDADGRQVLWKADRDGDGAHDWINTRSYRADGSLDTELTEWDDGSWGGTANDGVADTVRLVAYGADGAVESEKEDWGADGAYDKTLTYAYHGNGRVETRLLELDGVIDRRVLETFDDAGRLVLALHDDDGDGVWDRFEGGPGAPPVRGATDDRGRPALLEFDENGDGSYDRAETYAYGAGDLKIETVWYDDWALAADGSGRDLAEQTPDRALTVADGDADGTGESRRHDVYAAGGVLILESLFDDDNAPDGRWERAEGYGYDAFGRLVLLKTGGTVVGADPESARVVWSGAEIRILDAEGGAAESRFFDAYDGSSDFAALASDVPDRVHRFGTDHDGDGTADIRRDALDGRGRVVLSVFENGADGSDQWAVAYEYGAGNLKTRTVWHDDWDPAKAPGRQTVSRMLTVEDADADGAGESRQHDAYDGGRVVRSLFDDDNAPDGGWERAEGYERDAAGRIVLAKAGDAVSGADPETATVVWSRAETRILSETGAPAEIRFFDAYDGSSDFAALADAAPDRISRFGLELDKDGGDDARHDKLDAAGLVVESLFDIDGDGTDRAEAYAYDAAGRRTETRFHDPHTGTFDLSAAAAGKIHSWTYAADTADGRWLSFSEDFDGDGNADVKTTVTRGAGDILATRVIERDDGSGGRNADDGAVDERTREIFDPIGILASTEYDDNLDGAYERTEDGAGARRFQYDGKGRITLAEIADEAAPPYVYDRAIAWEYGVGSLKVKTTWYDEWMEGKALNDQTPDRALTVADGDADGAGDSRRHEIYGDDGETVTRALFDDADAAGGWDRAEAYERDGDGLVLKKTGSVLGTGADPGEDAVAYTRAEIYLRDGAAVSEIRFFDAGRYDGSADFDALTADGVFPSRVHRFGLSLDGVGANDDKRYDTLNGDGRIVRSVFDHGPDPGLDAVEDYEAYDAAGRVAVKRVGAASGADPAAPAVAWRGRERYTYEDGSGDRRVLIEYDAAGGETASYTRAERYTWDGAVNTKIEFFDEGGWTPGAANVADRAHHLGRNLNDDPAADIRRDTLDEAGRVVLSVFEDGADGSLWAATREYGAGGLTVKVTWHDDWTEGAPAAGQAFDRVLTVVDGDGDGTGESRRHDTHEDGGGSAVVRTLFDDADAVGGWDRAEAYEYDAAGRLTLLKTGSVAGADEDPDDDAVSYAKAELHLTVDGARQTRFFDAYDGSSDAAALAAAVPDRIRRLDLDLDGDGASDDARHDTLDAAGRTAASLLDIDADGTDRAEAHEYDAAGRRTATRFYDSWTGGYDFSGATADRASAWTYAADAADGRWLSFSEDLDNDGVTDRKTTVVRRGDADLLAERRVDHDDGAGAADDGTVDRSVHETFDIDGRLVATQYDDDGDGVWDRRSRHSSDGRDLVTLTEFDGNGDGAYTRAEAYLWNADGSAKIRTDFYDTWDGGAGVDLAGLNPDRSGHFLQDYDGDGASDDGKTETFDRGGRPVRIAYDYGSDGGVDRIEEYAYGDDLSDARWLSFTEDTDGDGTPDGGQTKAYGEDGALIFVGYDHEGDSRHDKTEAYTYHADGALKTRLIGYDDGSGPGAAASDGVIDRRTLETYGADGALESVRHDDDNNDRYDRRESYAYTFHGNGAVATKTTEYDDGSAGGRGDDGVVDKTRHAAYDVHGAIQSRKDDWDNNGTYDLTVSYAYHDNGELKEKVNSYDDGDYGHGIADDGTVDNKWSYSYDEAGRQTSRRIDQDNDGTYDSIETRAYHEGGGLATKRTEWDNGARGGTADDGTVDASRLDTYYADGALKSTREDWDNDGAHESTETWTYHENGRRATWLFETDNGVIGRPGVGADDGTVDSRSLHTYDAEGRLRSDKDDWDNDGVWNRVETHTRHENGVIKTTLTEHDDGSGGGTDDDGTVDRRVHETFDEAGGLLVTSSDDDNDGRWDRYTDAVTGVTRRHGRDGAGRIVLTEFDGDGDGVYTRAVAYSYGAGGLVVRTAWYDDWAVEADGSGRPLAEQTVDRVLTVADGDGDGEGDSRRHDEYDAGRVVRTLFDPANAAGAVWERAEAYVWNAAGDAKVRTDFFGGWDQSRPAADHVPDKSVHVMRDYDGDGDADDGKTVTFDGGGRPVRVEYDHDADGGVDRADEYAYGADPSDARWRILTEDLDNDGTDDRKTVATWHGTTDAVATRRTYHDDGTGAGRADDGVVDRGEHETFSAGGALAAAKLDDDGDGSWDRYRRHASDGENRITLSEFDENGDGTYTRAEAYVWSGAGKVRTDFHDDWDDSLGTADLAGLDPDRSAHFRRDYDGVGGADDAKTETFDAARPVRVEYDHGSDGVVDRVEKYTYEGADRHWKTYWENDDAAADGVFELQLTAARDADGRINALDASGSTAGVDLVELLAGNTRGLTVDATDFDDSAANAGISGGRTQTFNLGGGRDAFRIALAPIGLNITSPQLNVNAGAGEDAITAAVDVEGKIAVDGGPGDDVFRFVREGVRHGLLYRSSLDTSNHLIRFDGGAGDDTLQVGLQGGRQSVKPRAHIEDVENIQLAVSGGGAEDRLELRLHVAAGFNDPVTVTNRSDAAMTTDEVRVVFALPPFTPGESWRGGAVDVSNVAPSGVGSAAVPSIGVEGGPGHDRLTGGPGRTIFGFRQIGDDPSRSQFSRNSYAQTDNGQTGDTLGGRDTIVGYNAAEGDIVEIAGIRVIDGSTTVRSTRAGTVISYRLEVDPNEGRITVADVFTGVEVLSETSRGLARIPYTTPQGRFEGLKFDGNGRLVNEGFDLDGDGTMDRYDTYARNADGVVTKRTIEFGDAVAGGAFDRRREETYEDGALVKVRIDLDGDSRNNEARWDLIDAYMYPDGDARPRSVQRTQTQDSPDTDRHVTTTFSLHQYHGGDGGDGRVGGAGERDEWLRAGPGDDVLRGRGGADWFVFDAGDGLDTILDFSPVDQKDRIWIREDGVGFDDLAFADGMRKAHPLADSASAGVAVSWGGAERLWLAGRAEAELQSGHFLFGDEAVVVPDGFMRQHVRDPSGRTTEVRYYDGWDGLSHPEGLDPDRVHRYAYQGDGAHWSAVSINDDPFENGVFETRVAVERYGNGDPVTRVIEYDDGSGGGDAGDGSFDRKRQDTFDRDGRIVETLHDLDNDGNWDFIDAFAYDAGDGLLPRARSAERRIDANDDGFAESSPITVRLVFGTDGNDRGAAAIQGSDGVDEWFIPGPGDDVVDIGNRSANDKDVYIIEYGDGRDLLGVHGDGQVTDTIWVRESGFDFSSLSPAVVQLADDALYDDPGLEYPAEAFAGGSAAAWHYGDALDRFIIYGADDGKADFWGARVRAPSVDLRDEESFIYGSRNKAWTLDDAGRVTEIRLFDAWDGIGDPSMLKLAPDRVHRYAYEGDETQWTTFSKNENAAQDDVFEYEAVIERGAETKVTARFDDGRGAAPGRRVADDGVWDRAVETTTSTAPARTSQVRYDHDNDGSWDVTDVYVYTGSGATPDRVDRTVAGVAVQQKFVGGTAGPDKLTGTDGADWVDAGKGADDIAGGAGPDVLIFRYGDGTDVVRGFAAGADAFWVREDGFDPADVEASPLTLRPGDAAAYPYIPSDIFPTSGVQNVAILTYGGEETDRIIIVGGTSGADFYRAHFLTHDGHVPDFGGG